MGIKNFIDRLLNNHFEIIKSEVEEYDYPIDYYYFSDKYLGNTSTGVRGAVYGKDSTKYEELRQQVKELKSKLDDAGYDVRLDTQYGLKLTVSKSEDSTGDFLEADVDVSENVKNLKYLKRFK